MANLTTYVYLILGMSIALYLAGYAPPFVALMQNFNQENIAQVLINSFLAIFTNPIFLISLGIAGISSFVSAGNFSIMYIFPILMIVALLNFFVIPTSFLLQADLPDAFKLIASTFINVTMSLAIVNFIRGGG